MCLCVLYYVFFFSSVRQHTRCALVTGFRRVLFRSPAATPRPVERRTQDDIGPGALRRAQIGGVEGGDVEIAARRLAGTLPPFGSQPRNTRGKRLTGETFDLHAARGIFADIGIDRRPFLDPPAGQSASRREDGSLRKVGRGTGEAGERGGRKRADRRPALGFLPEGGPRA